MFKYNFQCFYEAIKLLIIYLTEIELMEEDELILNLYRKSSIYFKFSGDCQDFLREIGNIKINKIIDILLIFEQLSFENLIKNLSDEYKKELSEEIMVVIKYKIVKKEFNNDLFTIKDLGSAIRRYITRYLIGNMNIDINEKRDLLFELTRKDLWKESIYNSDSFEKTLSNIFDEYKLNVDKAYTLYKLIGEEDRDEIKKIINS